MKLFLRTSQGIQNLALIAGILVLWLAFAPVQLGGQTSFVIVSGNSMEPVFYRGDLVLLRNAASYQVDDIITFYDRDLHSPVIHRIIGIEQQRFVTRGDNNSWIDEYHPERDDIAGKYWFFLPRIGNLVIWLRKPLHMAMTVGLVGGLFMANFFTLTRVKKNRKKKGSAFVSAGWVENAIYVPAFLALVSLGLAIFAFTRPLTRIPDPLIYSQTGGFFYSATGSPNVYDTGSVQSGEPAFTHLTCTVNLGFVYTLSGTGLEQITGSHQLKVTIVDSRTGWTRTLPLTDADSFSGNTFTSMAVLDLCQTQLLVQEVEKEIAYDLNADTLVVWSDISVAGKIAGQTFRDVFDPRMTLQFDQLHVSLKKSNSQDNPLQTTQKGAVPYMEPVANTVNLFGLAAAVSVLRLAAGIGLGCSLAALMGLGIYLYQLARSDPDTWIRLKYGQLIVEIQDEDAGPVRDAMEVRAFTDLVRIAERHNSLVLHFDSEGRQIYQVRVDGRVYFYPSNPKQVREPEITAEK